MDALLSTMQCLDDEIPGAVNFRDAGGGMPAAGGRVRIGQLYRSGMTHMIEPSGLAHMRDELAIRSIVDFRSTTEHEDDGLASFAEHGLVFHHLPVYTPTALTPEEKDAATEKARADAMARRLPGYDWGSRYQSMLAERPGAYVRFFEIIADPDALPALFHCAGGRDRTGVAAALALSVLGVDDSAIARDYARTGALLRPHAHRFARIGQVLELDADGIAQMLETREDDMLRFLAWLRAEHGGAESFLLAAGVSSATLGAVRANLLDPA